jgi:hypothetical protein
MILKSFFAYYENMERIRFTRYKCYLDEGHDEGQLKDLFCKLNQGGYYNTDDGSHSGYRIRNMKSKKEVGHLTIGPNLVLLLDVYGSPKLKKIAKNFNPYSVFKSQ